MGYVAIQGGETAIFNAVKLTEYSRLQSGSTPLDLAQIRSQFRAAVDKIMGEGSLYAPDLAALALKQMEGDLFEAAFSLRAYRATLKREFYSDIVNTEEMFLERRVSALHRVLPGGQILGATRDYEQRFLSGDLIGETLSKTEEFCQQLASMFSPVDFQDWPPRLPKVTQALAREGILRGVEDPKASRKVVDITREAIKYPAPRSAALQMLARAETGGLVGVAYSSIRGHGEVEPVVAELRVGRVPVRIRDRRGRKRCIGRLRLTEAEVLTLVPVRGREPVPYLSMGYGLCFGQMEEKAIGMGILDRSMRLPGDEYPASSQEFVLYHTEGVESYGFTNHLKLPHYVTFQSGLNQVRQARQRRRRQQEAWQKEVHARVEAASTANESTPAT